MLSFLYKNYNNLTRSDSSGGLKTAVSSKYYNANQNPVSNIPCKNSLQINPQLQEYSIKLTNDSIRKVTDSYNKDKCDTIKTFLNNFNIIVKDDSTRPNNLLGYIFCLLSSTTFVYYFYKFSWQNMFSLNRYIDVSRK